MDLSNCDYRIYLCYWSIDLFCYVTAFRAFKAVFSMRCSCIRLPLWKQVQMFSLWNARSSMPLSAEEGWMCLLLTPLDITSICFIGTHPFDLLIGEGVQNASLFTPLHSSHLRLDLHIYNHNCGDLSNSQVHNHPQYVLLRHHSAKKSRSSGIGPLQCDKHPPSRL